MRAAMAKLWDSDLVWSWLHTPVAIVATLLLAVLLIASFGADLLAPHNPFDLATINLIDALKPPVWHPEGTGEYLLGTDSQGRDLLSALMYGARVSLLIGLAAVVGAMSLGIVLGLISGYAGGRIDALIMRIADVQLSFPAILIALLIDGVARAVVPGNLHEVIAYWWARSRWRVGRSMRAPCEGQPWSKRIVNTCKRHGSLGSHRRSLCLGTSCPMS